MELERIGYHIGREATMNGRGNYFQVLCMAFFIAVFAGRSLYLLFKKGINPFKLGVGKGGFPRVVELSFALGLLAWIVEVLLCAFHAGFRLFPHPLETRIVDSIVAKDAGLAAIIVAFVIFIWALVSFRDSWRIGIDTETQGELITNGIFSVSRNPIFLFVDIYFIGTFLLNGTPIFLAFAVVVVAGMHYQILHEEKSLLRSYGQAYQDYLDRTGRYLGRRHNKRK
jgi:protein-S-isoprenylcysteine O-methyltransferase Ste14